MALRKKHEVLEEPQDYEIERRETPRYNPDPEAGLSAAQVEQHREDGWRNVSVAPPAQTTKEIIRENVCTYFNLIFLVFAILLCVVLCLMLIGGKILVRGILAVPFSMSGFAMLTGSGLLAVGAGILGVLLCVYLCKWSSMLIAKLVRRITGRKRERLER